MRLLAVLLGLLAPAGLSTSPLQSALATGLRQTRAPGAQAAIYRCGRLVWSGVAGITDKQSRRPVAPTTRFVIASATKTVTGTMIMQLVQQGKLTLDTPLARFYPQLPNAGSITVEMLLRHRSGLPDYEDAPSLQAALNDPRHRWTRDEIIRALSAKRPLFAPGSHYRYTNSNFVVLGGILEQVGGRSIEQAFQSGIAAPLGLTHSSFATPHDSPLFAHPYSVYPPPTDQWVPGYGIGSDTLGPVWTDGGLATTALDLARFGDGLFGGRLVTAATLAQMTRIDGSQEGLGVEASDFDGLTWLGHSGSYGGFESEVWYDGTRGVTIALTTNMDEADSAADTTSDRIWVDVAGAYDNAAPDGAC